MLLSLMTATLMLGAFAIGSYVGKRAKVKPETPTETVPELAEKLSLVTEDEEITEWMPRLDIDLRDHTVIETLECGDCQAKESYILSMADDLIMNCPKCKSRAVFVSSQHANTKKPIPAFVPMTSLPFDAPEDWTPENDDDTEPLFG